NQFPQCFEIAPVKVHPRQAVLQSCRLAHMTALSIAKSAAAVLRLVNSAAEEFPHQRPLHLLGTDRCIDWQYCQRYSRYRDASHYISRTIYWINHNTVGR